MPHGTVRKHSPPLFDGAVYELYCNIEVRHKRLTLLRAKQNVTSGVCEETITQLTITETRLIVNFNTAIRYSRSTVRPFPFKKVLHFARAIDNSLKQKTEDDEHVWLEIMMWAGCGGRRTVILRADIASSLVAVHWLPRYSWSAEEHVSVWG